jgi:hypothetical protein
MAILEPRKPRTLGNNNKSSRKKTRVGGTLLASERRKLVSKSFTPIFDDISREVRGIKERIFSPKLSSFFLPLRQVLNHLERGNWSAFNFEMRAFPAQLQSSRQRFFERIFFGKPETFSVQRLNWFANTIFLSFKAKDAVLAKRKSVLSLRAKKINPLISLQLNILSGGKIIFDEARKRAVQESFMQSRTPQEFFELIKRNELFSGIEFSKVSKESKAFEELVNLLLFYSRNQIENNIIESVQSVMKEVEAQA